MIDLIIGTIILIPYGIVEIVKFIKSRFSKAKSRKINIRVNALKTLITELEQEITLYNKELCGKQAIINLLELINLFDLHVSGIDNKPEFNSIKQLNNRIDSRRKMLIHLYNELEKIENK